MIPSLRKYCVQMREVISGKGSRFLLCKRSVTDHRFPKYPTQPVVECIGFERSGEVESDSAQV